MKSISSSISKTTRTHLGCVAALSFSALSNWYDDMLEQPSTPDPGQETAT
ncbi:MAG: hypothetical protein KGZ70_13185 [Hydrogenophaga sp.]|nr:hypothetical protein [Hydrogenophaga sp.]